MVESIIGEVKQNSVMKRPKIALIQPSVGKIPGENYIKSWNMYPLNLAVIARLSVGYDIKFIDDRHDEIDVSDCDVAALSVETYSARRSYVIAKRLRENGVKVILGGIHPTLMPEEAQLHADSIILGDAEPVWHKMLQDITTGSLQSRYESRAQQGILEHVAPDRSIFNKKRYLPIDLVETGRGCPYRCDFCSVTAQHNQTYRCKDIEGIVADVKSTGSKNIYFVDDNFVSNPNSTKALCDAIEPLGIRWTSQGSINMAEDPELLKKIAKSGCFNMLIGFESLNPKALEAMGKSWASARRSYEDAIKRIRDHGITIYATFVFGYDTDTKDDFKRVLDFSLEQKFGITAFNHLVPFPGTPLYRRLNEEGRLIDSKWWLRDGAKFGEVVYRPANMSAEELSEGCFNCREQFYKYSSIAQRMWDFKANAKDLITAGYLLWVNVFSRDEAQRRQGWPIGGTER